MSIYFIFNKTSTFCADKHYLYILTSKEKSTQYNTCHILHALPLTQELGLFMSPRILKPRYGRKNVLLYSDLVKTSDPTSRKTLI